MSLESLLKDNKITLRDSRLYTLFSLNDMGVEILKELKEEIFFFSPNIESHGALAFLAGRKNLLQEIEQAIINVTQELKRE